MLIFFQALREPSASHLWTIVGAARVFRKQISGLNNSNQQIVDKRGKEEGRQDGAGGDECQG